MRVKRVSFSKKVETRTIDEIDRQSEESRSDEESRQFNKFQLLNLVDGVEVNNKDDEDNTDEAIHSDEECSGSDSKEKSNQQQAKRANSKVSKKSRKRRNKKNKGAQKDDRYEEVEFDIGQFSRANSKEDPDQGIQMYAEFNKHIKLLKIDPRNLLPDNELKKMFGKSVVRDDRQKYQGHVGYRSRFVNLRFADHRTATLLDGPKMELDDFLNEIDSIKNQDIKSKATTKSSTNSKSTNKNLKPSNIDMLFNSNRPVYFKFTHDQEYQAAHKEFVQAVHLANPEAIVHNITIYRNHAESLLQLSHILRLVEDYKEASEMIDRALTTFEKGFHTRFNLSTAQCRLSYRRPENRTFFIVLFEQITSCNRRGLRKTPFEYSKLLLSLEPENDPLMASQLVDFYALRSENYDFLIEFFNSWWQVQKLPNMNFSLAMAYFFKSRSNKQSRVDCEKNLQMADEQLQKSLLMFPNFILPLLTACSGEPSEELKKCTYFDYSPYGNKYKTIPETLEVLIELYVKRSFGLWRPKLVMGWLEKNVAALVEKFASGEMKNDGAIISEHWAQFKKPAPKNLLRHIALCDLKIKMPASASSATFHAVDPFPPTDAIVTYHSNLHQNSRTSASPAENSGSSLPGLFLRSFLPSFGTEEEQPAAANQQPHQRSSNDPRQTRQIDVDQEIALGEFVMNQSRADAQNPADDEASQLGDSLRNIVSMMTDLISMRPSSNEPGHRDHNDSVQDPRNDANHDHENNPEEHQD